MKGTMEPHCRHHENTNICSKPPLFGFSEEQLVVMIRNKELKLIPYILVFSFVLENRHSTFITLRIRRHFLRISRLTCSVQNAGVAEEQNPMTSQLSNVTKMSFIFKAYQLCLNLQHKHLFLANNATHNNLI